MFVLHATPALARQDGQHVVKLERIEFKGLERVKQEEALEKSGLKTGQSVSIDELDAVANRLLQSGLFKSLDYSIKGTTDKAVVTFTVAEQTWAMPVAFDNFVWFTDEELRDAIRRRVPAFDGTAPEGGNVTEQIKQALQDLLRERKIEGTVHYDFSEDPSTHKVEHLFGVKGSGLRVCKVNYQGARALSEELLVQKSGGIFDNDYSRAFVLGFVESNLVPLYGERGYLRASFGPPKAKPESTDECEKGLAVSMQVDEGSIYVWDKAAWEGTQALTAQELDAALGMRAREVANVAKIEKGLASVRRVLGRKGYLNARVQAAREFDDTNRTVAYRFRVEEGAQYRMGDLFIEGLSEADANNIRGRWAILHGDVYDDGYPDQFLKKNILEFQRESLRAGRPLPPMKIEGKAVPDPSKHVVNVTLVFKPDPTPPKPPTP
ncbi:MAG TPA: POTRA domain-containing protein [Pyrinomonadaceae bacterium]|nr:POTRA domain-containing protein [Pyrinomonadaceae bacterium]